MRRQTDTRTALADNWQGWPRQINKHRPKKFRSPRHRLKYYVALPLHKGILLAHAIFLSQFTLIFCAVVFGRQEPGDAMNGLAVCLARPKCLRRVLRSRALVLQTRWVSERTRPTTWALPPLPTGTSPVLRPTPSTTTPRAAQAQTHRSKLIINPKKVHSPSQSSFDSDQPSSVPLSLQSRLIHSRSLLLPPTPSQLSPASPQTKARPSGLYTRLPSRKSTPGVGDRRNGCPLPPLKAFAPFADRSVLCLPIFY